MMPAVHPESVGGPLLDHLLPEVGAKMTEMCGPCLQGAFSGASRSPPDTLSIPGGQACEPIEVFTVQSQFLHPQVLSAAQRLSPEATSSPLAGMVPPPHTPLLTVWCDSPNLSPARPLPGTV